MRLPATARRLTRILAAATAGCLLAACATVDFAPPAVPPLEGQAQFDIESVDPLALSTEMKQFVAARMGGSERSPERAWRMAHAMLDPWLFPFEYDPRITLTAREAFRTRRGNCLTFSNLLVASARELGLTLFLRGNRIGRDRVCRGREFRRTWRLEARYAIYRDHGVALPVGPRVGAPRG